jgi:hypothetical protein
MYRCGWQGCEKAYGTLNHLNAHVTMQGHGQKRTPEGMLLIPPLIQRQLQANVVCHVQSSRKFADSGKHAKRNKRRLIRLLKRNASAKRQRPLLLLHRAAAPTSKLAEIPRSPRRRTRPPGLFSCPRSDTKPVIPTNPPLACNSRYPSTSTRTTPQRRHTGNPTSKCTINVSPGFYPSAPVSFGGSVC